MHIFSFTLVSLLTTSLTLALPLTSPQCIGCGFPAPGKDGPEYSSKAASKTRHANDALVQAVAIDSDHATNQQDLYIAARQYSAPDEETAGVYICTDTAWNGTCTHHHPPLGGSPSACQTLDAGASSIGPDTGFYCIFYTNAFCAPLLSDGSDRLALSFPGTDDLGEYNDILLSYHCFKEENESIIGGNGTAGWNGTVARVA